MKLLLFEAINSLGLHEKENPEKLKEMFEYGKFKFPLTANWCGIAMYYWADHAELETPSYPAVARNWLHVGEEITEPQPGDVVVFWRESPSSWKGHVSIFLHWDNGNIRCLGGNQRDCVCTDLYQANRVIGYRRLRPK